MDFWRDSPLWDGFKEGAHELGADHVAIAALDRQRYSATKYAATIRHGLRGTALDWISDLARSSQLLPDDIRAIRESQVDLIHVNHVYTLGFTQRLRRLWIRGGRRIPMIVETHDVQSRNCAGEGRSEPLGLNGPTL